MNKVEAYVPFKIENPVVQEAIKLLNGEFIAAKDAYEVAGKTVSRTGRNLFNAIGTHIPELKSWHYSVKIEGDEVIITPLSDLVREEQIEEMREEMRARRKLAQVKELANKETPPSTVD